MAAPFQPPASPPTTPPTAAPPPAPMAVSLPGVAHAAIAAEISIAIAFRMWPPGRTKYERRGRPGRQRAGRALAWPAAIRQATDGRFRTYVLISIRSSQGDGHDLPDEGGLGRAGAGGVL